MRWVLRLLITVILPSLRLISLDIALPSGFATSVGRHHVIAADQVLTSWGRLSNTLLLLAPGVMMHRWCPAHETIEAMASVPAPECLFSESFAECW